VQLAVAEFMREGHYLRHLRRTKRAYAAKQEDLLAQLRPHFDADNVMATGLAVLLRLPDGTSDLTIAREILAFGMFPAPLSAWYASAETQSVWTLVGRRDIADKGTREILRPLGRYHPAFQLIPCCADGARSPLQHRRLPAERASTPGRPVQLDLAALGDSVLVLR
jgi:hypothetical protein